MNNVQPILECKKINKAFSGVQALKDVDFQLFPGEIHGLVGENGAGKSTLIKIFSGVYLGDGAFKAINEQNSGLFLEGKKVILKSPADAIKHKIMTIHQEINTIPDLMVYENIFLNNEKVKNLLLNRKDMKNQADEMLEKFGVDFSSTDIISRLSTDKRKLVEVLRAISQDAKIIIMDEPTSVLTDVETDYLFKVMQNISTQGVAIIFISHNLREVIELCGRITVLRDGREIETLKNENININQIVSLMIGKKLVNEGYYKNYALHKGNGEIMRVENYNLNKEIVDVSFTLNKGEIIGITGLVGSGGSVLAKTIFGLEGYKKDSGNLYIEGKKVKIKNTRDAIKNGIAFLTEDKKREGLFLKFKIYENITMPCLNKYKSKIGLLSDAKRRIIAKKHIDMMKIKAKSGNLITDSLSGGNQQKVVFSKWLETDPLIFIMAEPTRGIDVALKLEIRKMIHALAEQGKGIVLITNEFIELKELSSRVLIMFKGEIITELEGEEIQEDIIMKYALSGRS
ncbi:Ribose import ATP-binding protein RbsA [subsurface metagenome]